MQKEIFIPYINLSKPIGKKGKGIAVAILSIILVIGFFIVFVTNGNNSFKTIIYSKLTSPPLLKPIQGEVLSSQSKPEETLSDESIVPIASSSSLVNKTPTPTPTHSPTLTPTIVPSPVSSPTPILTITSAITPTPETNDVIPQYDGLPFASSQEKKDLLVLDFDSEVKGWTEDKTKTIEKKEGKKNNAISIKNSSFVLQNGEVFVYAGTLSFWLKLDEANAGSGQVPLIDWNYDGGNRYARSLFEISYAGAHDVLYFSLYDDQEYSVESNYPDPFSWHFITVTWDLTKASYKRILYIDGKKAAEDGFPFAPDTRNNSVFQLGGTLGNRTSAVFLMDEIVMTNYAKSEEEVANQPY